MDNLLERLGMTYVVLAGGILIAVVLLAFFPSRRRGDATNKRAASR